MDETLEFLKELTEAPGISGYEREVARVVRHHLNGLAEITQDNLGSVICRKPGAAPEPKIMLSGHMDEVGFMVTSITKEGFLRFQSVGGWWEQVMLAHRVVVKTSKGDVPGVIGSKPPHILPADERKKIVDKKDMFIDVGASSEEEARETFGVRPGDAIIPDSSFRVMANPKLLMAKAWDCRAGVAMFIEVIKRLAADRHPNTVYGVGSVQEEVGLRGATTSANYISPDIGFAVEVDIAGDTPGTKEEEALAKLGKGPSILLYDASMIPHIKLRDFVIDTARREGIPLQLTSMPGGGTDAGRIHIHGRGVPSLVIGVPSRYIHSHQGIIHRDDYENAVKLLVSVVKRLDAKTVQEIKGF